MSKTRKMRVIGRNYELSVLVDEEDYRTLDLGSYKWHRVVGRHTTYVATFDKNDKTIYLHRLIMGLMEAPRSVFVDHTDRNGLNNSRTNLRVTDNRGNQANSHRHLSAKNHSAYKGVSKFTSHKTPNPWVAQIKLSGKQKHLGCYRTEIEAARAYNKAAIEVFGPMAYLNIITPK